MLEGSDTDPATAVRLGNLTAQAETILERIAHWLSPGSHAAAAEAAVADRIAGLRVQMGPPLMVIIRTVGALTQYAEGSELLDVLRIGRACTELLAFVQQAGLHQPGGSQRAAPADKTTSLPPVALEASPGPAPARLLVIDDNAANLDMLSRQLESYGYGAVCVESGVAGIQALLEKQFDLVLLDVLMPDLDGVGVLQQMKAHAVMSGIPVIMISALDEVDRAAQCVELGAEDYLLKPFDPVLLRARLHSALERRRLEEERLHRTQELEKATEDLTRANEDLQSFASVASHDLQEPLRTITTTLQLFSLLSGDALTEEQRELSTLAVEGAARMSRLISDLLAFSFSGNADAEPQPVDCEAALLEAINNLRTAIKDSGAQITHGTLPVVPARSGGLVQLFQNLVANAINYRSEARPVIRITAEREGAEWVISVEDNGIGIDEKFRHRIFQPFGRLHGQERPGTGLGLAICERVVRRAGGRIWVDSELGRGSAFHFTLPCGPASGQNNEADQVEEGEAAGDAL